MDQGFSGTERTEGIVSCWLLVGLVFSFYKRADFNQFYQIQHKKGKP
jgi:hypothetical protein